MNPEIASLLERFEAHEFVPRFAKELLEKATEIENTEPQDALIAFRKIAMRIDKMPIASTREKLSVFRKASDLGRKIGDQEFHFDHRTAQLFREDGNPSVAGAYFEHAADAWTKEMCSGDGDKNWIVTCCLFREAQVCHHAAGCGDGAHRCFVRCKKIERDNTNELRKQISGWVNCVFWEWGESPKKVALWAAVAMTLFSLGYYFTGLTSASESQITFGTSLYFSVVTFTTLGFGDFAPATSLGRCLAATEAVLGIFFTGLFLVTFVKRYSR